MIPEVAPVVSMMGARLLENGGPKVIGDAESCKSSLVGSGERFGPFMEHNEVEEKENPALTLMSTEVRRSLSFSQEWERCLLWMRH